jgi:DNA-binding MarR family transcriptional regulator
MAIGLTSGEALRLWHAVHMHFVRDEEPDLSARQMAILLTDLSRGPAPYGARAGGKLAVSKPVITRALDSMGKHKLVSRRRDEHDRRNVLVQRTVFGALFLERLGDTVRDLAQQIRR